MRCRRIAFMRRVAHSAPKTKRFIVVLRFMAMIMIVHHAAFTPKRAEGIFPPARSSFITACAFSLIPQRSRCQRMSASPGIVKRLVTTPKSLKRPAFPNSCVGKGNVGALICGSSSCRSGSRMARKRYFGASLRPLPIHERVLEHAQLLKSRRNVAVAKLRMQHEVMLGPVRVERLIRAKMFVRKERVGFMRLHQRRILIERRMLVRCV